MTYEDANIVTHLELHPSHAPRHISLCDEDRLSPLCVVGFRTMIDALRALLDEAIRIQAAAGPRKDT